MFLYSMREVVLWEFGYEFWVREKGEDLISPCHGYSGIKAHNLFLGNQHMLHGKEDWKDVLH
jgi:hypothetical protein